MNQEGLKKFIHHKLATELDRRLLYHNLAHTIDVCNAVDFLAKLEHVEGIDLSIIQTAALLHDIGMTKTYVGHEEAGIEIARDMLPKFGYPEDIITRVCDIILTTKMPQGAKNHLDQILCDADLDYLGRPDYHVISIRLKYEWDELGIKPTTLKEWYLLQIQFLTAHSYYTVSARNLRQDMKLKHLKEIRQICMNNYSYDNNIL